jgi:SSS family solute:Na+ symporter
MAATQGFATSIYPLAIFGITLPGYAALYSVVLNLLVVFALSPVFGALCRGTAAEPAK